MPMFSAVIYGLAFLTLVGMFIYDPEGTACRLKRMFTFDGRLHMPARKPKKERLLSPWEIAAIEIECGMEPSWTPPPVASLVTRKPGFQPFTPPLLVTYDPAKDGPIVPLPSLLPTTYANERPRGSEPQYTCLTCHRTSSYQHTNLSCPGRKERR